MPLRVHTRVPDNIQSFPQLMYVFSHGTADILAYAVAANKNLILMMPPTEFQNYVHENGDAINGVLLYEGRTNYWGVSSPTLKGDGQYIKSLREAGTFIALSSYLIATSKREKRETLPKHLREKDNLLSQLKLLVGYYFL